jgi:hypothetical protein
MREVHFQIRKIIHPLLFLKSQQKMIKSPHEHFYSWIRACATCKFKLCTRVVEVKGKEKSCCLKREAPPPLISCFRNSLLGENYQIKRHIQHST